MLKLVMKIEEFKMNCNMISNSGKYIEINTALTVHSVSIKNGEKAVN